MRKLLFLLVMVVVLAADPLLQPTQNQLQSQGGQWAQDPSTAQGMFTTVDVGACNDPWQNTFAVGQLRNVFLVMVIVAMGLGLLYLIGQLLQSPKILATAKDEFFQLLQISTIVATLFVLIQGGNMWYVLNTSNLASLNDPIAEGIYSANPTVMDAAMAYSRLMVFKLTTDLSVLAIFNSIIHTLYTSTLWVGINFRTMWTFNLGPALKPIIDILSTAMQFLGISIGEWILHLVMLCLVKTWFWGIFFPMAMLLYMIPYTRSAGVAILSVMFSIALVYPAMLVANYEIYRLTSVTLLENDYLVTQFIDTSGLGGLGLLTLTLVFMMAGVLMPFFAGSAITLSFELIRNAIYYFVIISLLLPFINIFVTLTVAREFARSFGTNVNFMSFLRLI